MLKLIWVLIFIPGCSVIPSTASMSAASMMSRPAERVPYATVTDIGNSLFEYTEMSVNGVPSVELVPGRTNYLLTVHMPPRSTPTHVYVSCSSLTRGIYFWPGETLGYERVMRPNAGKLVRVELMFYDTTKPYRFGNREDAFATLDVTGP